MSNFSSAVSDINGSSEDVTHASSVDAEPASCEVRARLKRAKQKAADAQVIVVEKGRKSARAANDYAHDRPWTTAGVALGIGVRIGRK
ncbi:ElaB/YqjD/DUF883 family membrane-anchored ribosome-binding protein [Paraburkholderia silvatlantica]|uniref:ElaB/YqjD/DUF883 family membrane-anchored ribosome-binding protein n=1 Tax=Paraburkholderia silvatlantica TaxID=321895 RepID=A0A2V4TXA3_9BURK|nr:ElaB/YqjD/DUF883 family membrane-anchored ribosome-binding protein [Paraburkholderia silvatlantica]TDQ77497.1 ElaB/YqjD/DUF883 family membrane-anchored ribosome-binding protein [Paraburkholderia silvatlantica]